MVRGRVPSRPLDEDILLPHTDRSETRRTNRQCDNPFHFFAIVGGPTTGRTVVPRRGLAETELPCGPSPGGPARYREPDLLRMKNAHSPTMTMSTTGWTAVHCRKGAGADEPSSVRIRPGRCRGGVGDGGGGAAARRSTVDVPADPQPGAGTRRDTVCPHTDRTGAHRSGSCVSARGGGRGERVAAGAGDGAGRCR